MCTTTNRVYVVGFDLPAQTAYWARPDCHSWSCPDCAEVNKRRWTAIIAHGIEHYQAEGITEWRFITITSHERLSSFTQTLWVWRKAWPKLYARMKRAFPGIHYVYLPERHKDGRLHMHALSSGGITTRWIKDNARACGFGYKAESEEPLSISLACFYVTKYISKSLDDRSLWPKSLHRVRTSQKWPKIVIADQMPQPVAFKPVPPSAFEIMLADWRASGIKIVNFQSGELDNT